MVVQRKNKNGEGEKHRGSINFCHSACDTNTVHDGHFHMIFSWCMIFRADMILGPTDNPGLFPGKTHKLFALDHAHRVSVATPTE